MGKILQQGFMSLMNQPLKSKVDISSIERWASMFWNQVPHSLQASSSDASPFVMMFPPPNITGNLHLGHALTGAIQDAITRQKRMQGYRCIFIPGFDHAGLATQSIVEKQLWKKKGISRQQLGREGFLKIANEWKDKKRSEMRDQLSHLGLELNEEREYFTMDDNSSRAVQEAFKQLFEAKIIYRSTKDIFWSQQLQTTLSDIEVEKVDGKDCYIRTGESVTKRPISQWFIKADLLARRAVDAVEQGNIEIIPNGYKNSWYSWLVGGGVEDWCISRQSWWGHSIPAYKLRATPDDGSSWVVANNISEAMTKLDCRDPDNIMQDPDVLDTWFSSSLLPLTVSGWPDREEFRASCDQARFPLQMMETGFDILTFWVSKMVMMSLALTNQVPFTSVVLHGMICDSDGKKMSKSRGNVIDPMDIIDGASLVALQKRTRDANALGILEDDKLQAILENQERLFPFGIPQCGADGLRAYLLSHDFLEEVVRIRIGQIDKIRRLTNKIWNVYRFFETLVHTNQGQANHLDCDIQNVDIAELDKTELDADDRQVLSALLQCIRISQDVFDHSYELHRCFYALELFWVTQLSHEYIEAVKGILLGKEGNQDERSRKFRILSLSIVTSIKLLHPFMPHLTEFLYQRLQHLNGLKSKSDSVLKNQRLSQQSFPDLKQLDEILKP